MKWSQKVFTMFLASFVLSGCNVADKINENILDIETEDPNSDKTKDTNLTGNQGSTNVQPDTNSSNNNNGNTNPTTCSTGFHLENSVCVKDTNQTQTQCQVGYHISGDQCIKDTNISLPIVQVDEFNLTFPEYSNSKSIDIVMAKNSEKNIVIKSNPKQTSLETKLKYQQYTNNSVVSPNLIFGGAPIVAEDYVYRFRLVSTTATGKDEFKLYVENENGFTDSVYVNVEVINQIKLAGVRDNYSLVMGGDEQNISITAYNTLGNPLEFEIVNQSVINEEGKISLVVNGSKIFPTNTANGVTFKFSARGMKEDQREIQIKVKDRTTGTVESIYITIESAKRNTQFYVDLYECNENLSKTYEITTDTNTPLSPDGVYSSDNAVYLKSTHEMDYDIGNKFSTVMIFHPTNGQQYSYDNYGKEYIRNLNTGDRIATVYFAKHLQGIRYYVKYYDEDKNTIVCEKRNFGYIDTIDGGTIGSWEDQYTTPTTTNLNSSSGTGSIPVIF